MARGRFPVLFSVLVMTAATSLAATEDPLPTAAQLLQRAIEHHDPYDRWTHGIFELGIGESRPDGSEVSTSVLIDNLRGRFEIATSRDGVPLEGHLDQHTCAWRLNGSEEITDEQREQYRLTCDRLQRVHNYYVFLWGLPMKLTDPGTRLDDTIETTGFQGRDVWSIRVTYDPAVGSDTWYFYFNPADAALVGYRFYHDESAGDGEYIILEDTIEADDLTLPARRIWYTNRDNELLGTDTLRSLEVAR